MTWIAKFEEFTETLPSPTLFKRWAAVSAIAGALERKVWVDVGMGPLYPNLYAILVAPPGIGKTVLTSIVWEFWDELEKHHNSSSSLTKAALIDELYDARRDIVRPQETPSVIDFNSLLVSTDELGVLLPAYDPDFMNTLTHLYDGKPYSERRRTKDLYIKIERPQLNLFGATTPSYLNNLMPMGAWDQGFASRTLFIYSGETVLQPLFQSAGVNESIRESLVKDLRRIAGLYGKIRFSEEAADAITHWHMAGGPPVPDHPQLTHYNIRRTAHLLKLCMIMSAAEGDTYSVSIEQFRRALDFLLETETFMPDIFKSMSVGGDSRAIEAAYYFVYQHYTSKKKPMDEGRLVNFLSERVPIHSVERVLSVMIKGELLQQVIGDAGRAYKPLPKKPD